MLSVPGVVAGSPGQVRGEGGEEEVQAPGDDDVVEEIHVEGDQHHRPARAWRTRGVWERNRVRYLCVVYVLYLINTK